MKKIEAIIRKSKFEDIKKALYDAGIEWFSYWDLSGVGKSAETLIVRGQAFHSNYLQRHLLCIIVCDNHLDKTVEVVMAARTGEKGDGKIFVSPLEENYCIRTADPGSDVRFGDGLSEINPIQKPVQP